MRYMCNIIANDGGASDVRLYTEISSGAHAQVDLMQPVPNNLSNLDFPWKSNRQIFTCLSVNTTESVAWDVSMRTRH